MKNITSDVIKQISSKMKFKFPYDFDDYAEHLYFENYHCHKDFSNTSTPDCGELTSEYIKRIKEFGGKCLYSMEHGSCGNYFETYLSSQKSGLKYRHSTEAYWVKDRLEQDNTNCHMVLVAKNQDGKGDLNFALSMANIDGYYYKPRIDLKLLKDINPNNIILTSACLAGWRYDDAEYIWLDLHERFGDNFFFEVQANNTDEQKRINERILRLAEKHDVQIIAGLDSHYINNVGKVKRDQILEYKKIKYPEEEGWFMDYPDVEELIRRFVMQGVLSDEQILLSIMNTNVFVNECEEITFDRHFKIPTLYPDKTYEEKCNIYKRELNLAYSKEDIKSNEKKKGILFEAKQVMDSGVVDYFLTTKAIIEEAVNNQGGIITTTSRGSAASYITNKLIGITTVDRYNAEIPMYPERFLTKDRVLAGSMPD